jgi:hypothetical protein
MWTQWRGKTFGAKPCLPPVALAAIELLVTDIRQANGAYSDPISRAALDRPARNRLHRLLP